MVHTLKSLPERSDSGKWLNQHSAPLGSPARLMPSVSGLLMEGSSLGHSLTPRSLHRCIVNPHHPEVAKSSSSRSVGAVEEDKISLGDALSLTNESPGAQTQKGPCGLQGAWSRSAPWSQGYCSPSSLSCILCPPHCAPSSLQGLFKCHLLLGAFPDPLGRNNS